MKPGELEDCIKNFKLLLLVSIGLILIAVIDLIIIKLVLWISNQINEFWEIPLNITIILLIIIHRIYLLQPRTSQSEKNEWWFPIKET